MELTQSQAKQVREAADYAVSLVKTGVVEYYNLAIHLAAKKFVEDKRNVYKLQAAISEEMRFRYQRKIEAVRRREKVNETQETLGF
jgi:hypothetical protein